ncbi:hypothetical protein [Streptomyces acidicola]|uniref:hypothetical protein n=1 Tax=Streptomyces acidicola TaxID=2596892 RepID=UPI00343B1779
MIGVRKVRRASMRPSRVVLFLGLVFLITAHLAGAVHAASFAGPHVTVEVATTAHPLHDTWHASDPAPAHQHRAGDHIDHAADRPRTAAAETIAAPGHADPADSPSGSVDATPMPAVWCRPSDTAAPTTDSPGTLALHCVWSL